MKIEMIYKILLTRARNILYNNLFVSHNLTKRSCLSAGGSIMTTKRKIIRHLPILIAGFAMGLGVFSYSKVSKQPLAKEAESSSSDYWSFWISNNSTALSKGGTTLVTALKSKITQVSDGSANTVSYDGLWTAYKESDPVPGTESLTKPLIWDMYGGFAFTYGDDQAGSYSHEGDVYNREHSVPKSWFSQAKPAYSDLVHLVPTDGKVNGMRNNYTFGEVDNASYSYSFPARSYGGVQYQTAGISKLGTPKKINGVSTSESTVFEPDDQYKGDFARIYMYFAVRYGGGTCSATSGSGAAIFTNTFTDSNPYVTDYGLALLRKWHVQDKVSTKEISRNDMIQKHQNNRNPFVDHPEWADKIFGTEYGDPTPGVTISQETATIGVGGHITLTASASNAATITWTSSNSNIASVSGGVVTGVAAGSVNITASATINNTLYSATCAVTVSSAAATLQSISVQTAPTKTTYSAGECFDPTGLVITRNYSNSTSNTYTYSGHTSEFTFNPSTSTALSVGNTHVTISYGGKSTSQSITVTESGGSGETQTTSETIVFSEQGFSDGTAVSEVQGTYGTITFAQGSATNPPKYYNSGSSIRAYAKNTITFSSDLDIVEIVVTFASGEGSNSITSSPAGYSDGTWSGSANSVVLTIGGTSGHRRFASVKITYETTGELPVPTSISASVSKNYFVGDFISIEDITVKNDLNQTITDFDFEDDAYQFLYDDAQSGGALTEVLFDDAISSGDFRCSLSVNVSRKDYVAPSPATDVITAADLAATGTAYVDFSNVAKTSNARYSGNNAKNNNGAIQMRSSGSNSGIVSTISGGTIKSVSIIVDSGTNTVNVYGKNSAYSSASDLYNNSTCGTLIGSRSTSGTITFASSYLYVGIRSAGSAIYLSSITIEYGSDESAENIANYIMFTDTDGQCTTKLNTALGYYKKLTSDEKTIFQSSTDYVISTARTRLNAWARSQGKVIDYSDGSISSVNPFINLSGEENNNVVYMILVISLVGVSSIVACLYIRRKRSI